jgi:hypothetical protein
VRHGWRVLRRNVLRKRSGARWVIGPEDAGGYTQRHLEKVLEGARVGCCGGELRRERGSREADVRLAATALTSRSVFVVPGRTAVMVVFPVFDGRLVEGGLLQGDVGPTQPSERRNWLGDDQDQRQDMRGHGPERPGIKEALMERPS